MKENIIRPNGDIYSIVELNDGKISMTVGPPRKKFFWEPENIDKDYFKVQFDEKIIPQLIEILQKFQNENESRWVAANKSGVGAIYMTKPTRGKEIWLEDSVFPVVQISKDEMLLFFGITWEDEPLEVNYHDPKGIAVFG
jgi:hypothetical protein